MKLPALSVLLLFALGGCASTEYRIHPADYNREDISYIAPNDCRSLERRYAISLAWEKKERATIEEAKVARSILTVLDPIQAIAQGPVEDTEPEGQNQDYLLGTKKLFIDKGCEPVGYVAFSHRLSKKMQEYRGLCMCEQDAETGFYVCIKKNPQLK